MAKTLTGTVVSDRMQKTVVVAVGRLRKHPKYKRYYKVTARFKAHDETGAYHTGDKVTIQEIRPMSKDKRWTVVGLVKSEINPNDKAQMTKPTDYLEFGF